MQIDDFLEQTYTTKELDDIFTEYLKYRAEKDKLTKELKAVQKNIDDQETILVQALEETGKKSWESQGQKATISERVYPKLIKDFKSKKSLIAWLYEKGEDFALNYLTINHNSLGSLVKNEQTIKESEANPDGSIAQLIIPGVDLDYRKKTVSVRKAKV